MSNRTINKVTLIDEMDAVENELDKESFKVHTKTQVVETLAHT